MGLVWEINLIDFLLVTVFLGGGAAYLTGRALALTWHPVAVPVGYMVPLTMATRFIHFALFHGTLMSLQFFLVDFAILTALTALGFRLTRARQMVGQYHWLYERSGPFAWRRRPAAAASEPG